VLTFYEDTLIFHLETLEDRRGKTLYYFYYGAANVQIQRDSFAIIGGFYGFDSVSFTLKE